MNFSDLQLLARAYVPQGRASAVSLTRLKLLINVATGDVALRSRAIRTSGDFNSLANTAKYNLSSNLTRFLSLDEGGVWFNDGVQWRRMWPFTVARMRNQFPNFQDDDTTEPERYYTLGDDLNFHPSIASAGTSNLRVYFVQRPIQMTLNSHFPFHIDGDQTTEMERLETLSESILLYVESRVLKIIGKKDDSVTKFAEYKVDIDDKMKLINESADLVADKHTKFQGPLLPCYKRRRKR